MNKKKKSWRTANFDCLDIEEFCAFLFSASEISLEMASANEDSVAAPSSVTTDINPTTLSLPSSPAKDTASVLPADDSTKACSSSSNEIDIFKEDAVVNVPTVVVRDADDFINLAEKVATPVAGDKGYERYINALKTFQFTYQLGYIPEGQPIEDVVPLPIHNLGYIKKLGIPMALPLETVDPSRYRWVPMNGPNEVTVAMPARRIPDNEAKVNFPELREQFNIPNSIELHEVHELRGRPSHLDGVRICEGFLEAGLPLPIPPLVVRTLNHYMRAPAQMMCIFYRVMSLLLYLNKKHNFGIGLEDVITCFVCKPSDRMPYQLLNLQNGTPSFALSRRPGMCMFHPPTNEHWKPGRVFEIYGDIYGKDVNGLPVCLTHTECTSFGYSDANNLEEYPFKEPKRLLKLNKMTVAERREKYKEFAVFFGPLLEADIKKKATKEADFKARKPRTSSEPTTTSIVEPLGGHGRFATKKNKRGTKRKISADTEKPMVEPVDLVSLAKRVRGSSPTAAAAAEVAEAPDMDLPDKQDEEIPTPGFTEISEEPAQRRGAPCSDASLYKIFDLEACVKSFEGGIESDHKKLFDHLSTEELCDQSARHHYMSNVYNFNLQQRALELQKSANEVDVEALVDDKEKWEDYFHLAVKKYKAQKLLLENAEIDLKSVRDANETLIADNERRRRDFLLLEKKVESQKSLIATRDETISELESCKALLLNEKSSLELKVEKLLQERVEVDGAVAVITQEKLDLSEKLDSITKDHSKILQDLTDTEVNLERHASVCPSLFEDFFSSTDGITMETLREKYPPVQEDEGDSSYEDAEDGDEEDF